MDLEIAGRKIVVWKTALIEPDASIEQAQNLIERLVIEAFIVEQAGALKGILTKHDVTRAMQHQFAQQTVQHFMSKAGDIIGPNTKLPEIQKTMTSKGIECLPIVNSAKQYIAVVNRNEIARIFFGIESADETGLFPLSLQKHNVDNLFAPLNKESNFVLREVGTTATKLNMTAYLIGGSIRDLLLGHESLDLDFVVEGNAQELAKILTITHPTQIGILAEHERFQTAALFVTGNSTLAVDLATARTETYEHPGALPVVETSILKQDLSRRDFTINTLAVCMNSPVNYEILDYFGGFDDTKNGAIRILHSFSFIEDPTRLIRAARFAAKLNFRLDDWTFDRAKQAVELGVFNHIEGVRLKTELELMLSLPTRLTALNLLLTTGAFLARLQLTKKQALRKKWALRRVELWLSQNPLDEEWLIYLGLLLKHSKRAELDDLLESIHLTNIEKADVLGGAQLLKVEAAAFNEVKPSVIYRLFEAYSKRSLVMAMCEQSAGSPLSKLIKLYLTKLCLTETSLKGDDLIKMGIAQGPLIGKLLQNLLNAKLDDQISSKEDEIDFVKRALGNKENSP